MKVCQGKSDEETESTKNKQLAFSLLHCAGERVGVLIIFGVLNTSGSVLLNLAYALEVQLSGEAGRGNKPPLG